MRAEPASLELRIDYHFSHAELLRRALTHSSLANESHMGASSTLNDNEQLEFLGDSVLGFLVAEALVRRFPECREGELSRLKAHLVSAAHLHGVARRLDLGSYLELGRSEEMSGGRAKKTLLVDALEAIIGAIWLDGGLEAVRSFVAAHVLDAPFSAMRRRAPTSSRPSPISRARCRNWRRRTSCRNRATPFCGSAARSTPRRSRSRCGWARIGPGRPTAAPRRSPHRGRRAEFTNGCGKRRPRNRPPPIPWMEPARPHERLHEPGGIRQHRKIRTAFLVVPGHAEDPDAHVGSSTWRAGTSAAPSKPGAAQVTSRTCFRGNAAGRWCPWISVGDGLRYARQMGVERAVQGDIRSFPLPDGAFDLVMSVDVLAHLPRGEEQLAARELARVLAPGGLLVVRTAALDILRSRHSQFAFERQRFTRRRLMGH
jgi:hypothetical protein